MNREDFVRRYEADWERAEAILDRLDRGWWSQSETGSPDLDLDLDPAEFPPLYRRCCHHLAIVRQRHYGAALETRLNRIALRGYHRLYRQRRPSFDAVWSFVLSEFPRTVRRHAWSFWLVSALFYGSMIATGALILDRPDSVYSLLDAETVAQFEEMYSAEVREERGSTSDFTMFGLYIWNNISIAFRTFAAGIFAGIGTLLIVLFNGLMIGAVFGHLTHVGAAENLVSFVIAHGSFELTALVISGVAGFHLGGAVISPGRWTRADALRRRAPESLRLLTGAAVMLLVAAFIEAFWSSTVWVPFRMKMAVGAAAWILVALYLWGAGRADDDREARLSEVRGGS